MKRIIILSVIYNNYSYFKENYISIIEQNPISELRFIVVDNSEIVDESQAKDLINNPIIDYLHNTVKPKFNLKKNSFHHAIGLDSGLKYIKKLGINYDLLVVLDPDYFIFGQDWISVILNVMENNKFLIGGSPWGLRWKNKYKNFPCVQCIFISPLLVSRMPSFAPLNPKANIVINIWEYIYKNRYVAFFVSKLVNNVFDTGSLVYSKFQKEKYFLFEEISSKELESLGFYKNKLQANILNHINCNLNSIEVFQFYGLISVHFRSFGNSNINVNEK